MKPLIELPTGAARLESEHLRVENELGAVKILLSEAQRFHLMSPNRPAEVKEIERRFLVNALPPLPPGQRLRQGYLLVSQQACLRIREKEGLTRMTLKRGQGLARSELEFDLQVHQAKLLWPLCGSRTLEKSRFLVADGDGHLEVDIYHGRLEGLMVVEREFRSEPEAHAWSPPTWVGKEITLDSRYTNAALAAGGNVEEILGARSGWIQSP